MNSETFAKFLKTPAYLYRISYQELKSLVVQYPYCQNLRYLLLKKSQADQHPEYDRNLQMAATYSINRGFLYEQLYSTENTPSNRESNVVTDDELLELRDLETLDLNAQKEVLLAETKDELSLADAAPIIPALASLDLASTEEKEDITVFEGDISSDEVSIDTETNSAYDDLFSDTGEESQTLPELEILNAGHQISERSETIEEEEDESLDSIFDENIDNQDLDITEEFDEEDIPEVLPEASSDDIEDLFAEEPEMPEIQDTSSLGLDVETDIVEEDILQNTEETASDFMADVATGIGAVSISSILSKEEEVEEKDLLPIMETEEPNPATVNIADLSPVSPKENVEEEEEFEIETELISPQSSFSNWLKQFNSPQISVEIEDLDEKNQKKKVNYTYELVNGEWKQIKTKVKKKKKKSKAELIAAESVKLSKDVVTETLAQLLEKQEHYAKAIKMYERLRLENPEKSDYFAERIKTLQLKL